MTTFHAPQSHIHVIARVILLQGENVILCRAKGSERFFLPGGHVENGELAQEALARELKEELGISEYDGMIFAGVCEGIFPRDRATDVFEQQINVVFEVKIPSGDIVSQEDHIEFTSVSKDALNTYAIAPTPMTEGITEWFITRQPFFKSFQD
jgi:ADP-ribose pyrophosphatase YjhB (NUDIX family)